MDNFLVEPSRLPTWAKANGLTLCFVYRGLSMIPTFKSGDILYIHPSVKTLGVGDVVIFLDTNKGGYVVHRVISNSGEHLSTRGDHNLNCDSSPVMMENIIGKVELLENKHGIKPVANGLLGLWLARIQQIFFWLDHLFRQIFRKLYRLFRKSGLILLIWRPKIVTMQVQNAEGTQVKYIYKQHTVAAWNPALQRFDCRKPFDLVIPHPEEPH